MKIGLTGGIGSGKSTVAHLLENWGIPVYYSDQRAKDLMNTSLELRLALTKYFGEHLYVGGILDRAKLAKCIFSNKEDLDFVNSIVHPCVKSDFERWSSSYNEQPVVMESAILFESGAYRYVDHVLLISSPLEIRVKRVMKRDHCTVEEVQKRIESQWTEEQRLEHADYIIHCNDVELIIPQVKKWFELLCQ